MQAAQPGYVLWICSWYPNQLEPLNGDFIQRHAQAVSAYVPVHVISLVFDPQAKVTSQVAIHTSQPSPNLTETLVYYHGPAAVWPWLHDKLGRTTYYLHLGKKMIAKLAEQYGKPIGIHNHIALNGGMLAQWAAERFGVPYMVSEQWGAYVPEAEPNFRQMNPWSRRRWRSLMQQASMVSGVSAYLARTLEQLAGISGVVRIGNVVNPKLFYPEAHQNHRPVFIHIGTNFLQKNTAAILEAARLLAQRLPNFVLQMVAPASQHWQNWIEQHGLQEQLQWIPEMPQQQLAALVRRADALILYSRYETFGCVVIEAQACGIPVLASGIAPMHELIEPGYNGLIAGIDDPVALAKAMEQVARQTWPISKQEIANQTTSLYNFEQIGKAFLACYQKMGLRLPDTA